MLKQSQIFTVRSKNGDLIGRWRGLTASDAIAQAVRHFAQNATEFRQPTTRGITYDRLTASVEGQMGNRSDAVHYAMDRIMQSTESQEVEHALADDGRFSDLIPDAAAAQSIIRDAEKRLGNRIPADYA